MLEIVKAFGPVLIFLLGLWAIRFPRRAEMRKQSYVDLVAEWRKVELVIMSLPFKLRKDLEKAGFVSATFFDRKEEHKQIIMAVLNDFGHAMEGYTIAAEKILLSASPELRKELVDVEKLAGQMRFKALGWINVEMMDAEEHYRGLFVCREAVMNLRRGTVRAKVIM